MEVKSFFCQHNHNIFTYRRNPSAMTIHASSDGVVDHTECSSTLTKDYYLRFSGIGRLYSNNITSSTGDEAVAGVGSSDTEKVMIVLNRLVKATVVIVGIGGVGSWASEALCRSGIGSIVLVDLDDVCISNTNRQVHALSSTVGKFKIEEMKQRLHQINPHCNVSLIHEFVSKQNVESMLDRIVSSLSSKDSLSTKTKATISNSRSLCVLDAIDGKIEKAALIAACAARQIPIVTVGGSAGKTDPTSIVLQDLARVQDDRLLFACRKILRQEYGFKKPNLLKPKRPAKKWHIMAVYSSEQGGTQDNEGNNNSFVPSSSLRICDSALGTACYVTGTFGFVAAGAIIDMVASNNFITPQAFEKMK
jgi:tRNA A37 threonylcarbamoyladenosine dehydratase